MTSRTRSRARPARPEGGRRVSLLSRVTQNRRNANMIIDAAGVTAAGESAGASCRIGTDADTWNLNALNRYIRRYHHRRRRLQRRLQPAQVAPWLQDDWKDERRADAESRSQVRRDDERVCERRRVSAVRGGGPPDDTNNIQPRLGFAYQLNDRTVLRGGSGIYFGDAISADVNWMYGNIQIATIQIQNDGRADFATNPVQWAAAADLRPGAATVLSRQCLRLAV